MKFVRLSIGALEITMGVTIHFEGYLRDQGSLKIVLRKARDVGNTFGWQAVDVNEASIEMTRIIDEEEISYIGPAEGVQFQPHPECDPSPIDNNLFLAAPFVAFFTLLLGVDLLTANFLSCTLKCGRTCSAILRLRRGCWLSHLIPPNLANATLFGANPEESGLEINTEKIDRRVGTAVFRSLRGLACM